ncbi:HEAT repeat domain-containing protein [Coleofasciculus sp. FACHB-542]|uniref:HEAT repeat domain-containing protein n=1 Tax=Coleofasciculus sp. FACHB-542 TaxID=2692787 RepID=UPI001689FADB|nr:HEAT repeat domain-containing protein [Coleofasciculus sp. FACHB-542]MBD2084680.1 HEAT repeat domain-containing protein [Coleofasciculus sp. FACHB-542]
MVDWLLVWGVSQAVGGLVYPIVQDLAKEGAKDFAKDFFKDSLKHVLLREKDPRQVAAGKAIKEFLQLVQDELKDTGVTDEQLQQYTKPLKEFIKDKSVKEILGSAFKDDCQALDTKTLAQTWNQLNLLPLPPEEFDWDLVGKLYRRKVNVIIRELPELRAIFDSKNIEAIQQNTKELAGISTEFDLKRYQEGLQERYSNLNLDSYSLDSSVYDYREKLKIWEIFIAQNVRECQEYLPQVYEIPKEHQKRLRESNQLEADVNPQEWERYKQVYYQQPIRSVLDIINDSQTYPYFVILGDPGSGKSTLLQYIALNWAITPLNTVIEQPIPLLIELRTYIRNRDSGKCNDFLEFLHKGCGIVCRLNQHELHERLKAGKVLVMFDGLDEVFDPAKREEVITDIHRFTNDYRKARIIVTSRTIGYKPQRLRDAQFRHFMLQDLELEQIEDFLYRWHELTFTDEALKVSKRERLQRAIETSSAIGELAGNPLLLTMIAILNRKQELPRDRPRLYKKASEVLLHQWDVDQKLLENPRMDSVTIDYNDKQAILRQVAYHMQAADKGLAGNLIRGDDLERILTSFFKSTEVNQPRTVARLLIEQLRSRNFILCYLGADSYAFVHRTFLEYFCASEFVWQFEKERNLSLEQLKTEVFGKHWQDEIWHEVLRLIAGMIDTKFAGEILDYLMAQKGEDEKFINLFLAAECLLEVRNHRSLITPTSDQLLNQLKGLTQYDLPYRYEFYEDEADLVSEIRIQAVSSVATTWKDHPDTLAWLKQRAQADDDPNVRCAAVEELARGWKDDPDTLAWLKQRVQADDDFVRRTAVEELARGWKDDPDTLPILKQRAQADSSFFVRRAAVQELARGWKDDPDTLPILKQGVQADGSFFVRRAAVQELARGWKDDPDTLPILKQRAQTDDDFVVRRAAVQELARGWKDDPDTLPILKQRAQTDDTWNVREAAVEELARGWKDDPDTLPILKQRAQADDKFYVRRAAVQELARGWKDEPGMFEFLCDRALNDPFEREDSWEDNPRQLALEIIIKNYSNHPQTLPLLRDRSLNDPDQKVREFATEKLKNWSKSCE